MRVSSCCRGGRSPARSRIRHGGRVRTCPGGIPAQVFLRPLTNELAIVVARDVQRRLKPEAYGGTGVFESYDPVNNRRVSLIYDLTS
jgi:hypothetical protein